VRTICRYEINNLKKTSPVRLSLVVHNEADMSSEHKIQSARTLLLDRESASRVHNVVNSLGDPLA
jgi:hypothetical protein